MSTKEVKFPIVVEEEDRDYIKREVVANIVDKEEELFVCGRKHYRNGRQQCSLRKIDWNSQRKRRE